MGMEFSELLGMIVIMTKKGIEFNQAITMMVGVLNACIKPTTDMKKLVKSWGYETAQAAIEALGFIGFLQKIKEHTGDNAAEMGKLIPRVRGLTGAITVLSDSGAELVDVQRQIEDSSGTLNDKYKIMTNTFEHQVKVFKESINAMKRGIGEEIIPILNTWLNQVNLLARAYEDLAKWIGKALPEGWEIPGGTGREVAKVSVQTYGDVVEKTKEWAKYLKEIADEEERAALAAVMINVAWAERPKAPIGVEYEALDISKMGGDFNIFKEYKEATKEMRYSAGIVLEKMTQGGSELFISYEKGASLMIDGAEVAADTIVAGIREAAGLLTEAGVSFGASMIDILGGIMIPTDGGEERLSFADMDRILNEQLKNMSSIRDLTDEELAAIGEGAQHQKETLAINRHLYDTALESIQNDLDLQHLTVEQQEALAQQFADQQTAYLTSTEGLLSTINSSINALEMSPIINVYLDVNVDKEDSVSSHARGETEGYDTVGGR